MLDWERGQLAGPPGWDWFHYVLQTAILVQKATTPAVISQAEALLGSDAFQAYAARAGIAGAERPLLLAYLVHCVEVTKPAEGLPQTQELLTALGERWGRGGVME